MLAFLALQALRGVLGFLVLLERLAFWVFRDALESLAEMTPDGHGFTPEVQRADERRQRLLALLAAPAFPEVRRLCRGLLGLLVSLGSPAFLDERETPAREVMPAFRAVPE